MNGVLFYVFAEYCRDGGPESSMYPTYAKLCEENFVAGLQDYDCLVTPTLENIQSLLLGVSILLFFHTDPVLNASLRTGIESARRFPPCPLLDLCLYRSTTVPNPRLSPWRSPISRRTQASRSKETCILDALHDRQNTVSQPWTYLEFPEPWHRCQYVLSIRWSESGTLESGHDCIYWIFQTSGTAIRWAVLSPSSTRIGRITGKDYWRSFHEFIRLACEFRSGLFIEAFK